MQLASLRVDNFKGLQELAIDFLQDGEPRPLTLILGDNGSGKTTVLQAIALVLSMVTRKTTGVELRWPGFLAERVSTLGASRVELDVCFDADELRTIDALYRGWSLRVPPETRLLLIPPGDMPHVRLIYEGGSLTSPQGDAGLNQFLGRFFIRHAMRTDLHATDRYAGVGDVFWFDQNRNLATLGPEAGEGSAPIEQLREQLIGWWAYHTSPRRVQTADFLEALEKLFARLFPGTRFVGVEPRPGSTRGFSAYFLLERDGKTYDLAEMSSGEQAVFPLLYEFVRLRIARSVVLIDELELHLHPPQQQQLVSSLARLGPDCQFIVTSHSPYLESVVPDEDEVRLAGGRRCL